VGSSVDLTPDGGYLVAGYTESYSLYNDYDFLMREVYLIRLDGAGNTLWHKVKGIAPDSVETAADVQVLQDGSFVIAGAAGGSFLMARMDENGDTVGLGDDELNLTNPTSLTITLANAHIVAGRTLSLLNILSQAGAFGLDLLLAVQDDPSLNDGDTLSVTPAPDSLSAGQSYDVILDAFQTGDAGDLTTLGGSFTITIDSLTGALEDGGTYTTGITLSSIDMEQTDDVGTTHLAGSVGVSRQASPGSVVETVQNTPSDSFRTSSDSIDVTATAYSLSVASSQGGGFTLGAAGEEMVFDIEHMEGSLTMTVLSPVQGADPLSLTGGSVMIEAEDLSSVTLKFRTGGTVDLDVDADGDGTVDSTLSIPLDELD
jgi:hypothetical protein